jgi:RNA recognition motif-containing protein
MEKRLKNIQTFEQHSSELNISDVIKRLDTDDSEIKFGDYFLEVGEYNFIYILKDFNRKLTKYCDLRDRAVRCFRCIERVI